MVRNIVVNKLLMLLTLLTPITALSQNSADEPGSYFCTADLATGFHLVDGEWKVAQFIVEKSKYILRPSKDADSDNEWPWDWVIFDTQEALGACQLMESTPVRWMSCQGDGDVTIDMKTLKFQKIVSVGYLYLVGDSPHMEIGRCVQLSGDVFWSNES